MILKSPPQIVLMLETVAATAELALGVGLGVSLTGLFLKSGKECGGLPAFALTSCDDAVNAGKTKPWAFYKYGTRQRKVQSIDVNF